MSARALERPATRAGFFVPVIWPLPTVTYDTRCTTELHESDIGASLFGVFMRNPVAKIGVAVALCALVATVAMAQVVPGSITLRWVLPTTGCLQNVTPAVCNQPLTGSAALQAVHVWISTSPIVPDPGAGNGLPTAPPTLTLSAGATTASHTMTVTNGQTLYARVSARNPAANSALSAEVTKVIQIPVVPGVPTTVTIELTIG